MRLAFIFSVLFLFTARPWAVELKPQVEILDKTADLPGGEHIHSVVLTKKFYEARDYRPVWIENGKPIGEATDLLNAVLQSDREGLEPLDYHTVYIRQMMNTAFGAEALTPAQELEFELSLTDAFLTYGSDLLSGRINPYSVDSDWFAGRRTGDLPRVLEKALDTGDIRHTLRSLLPTHPIYQRMRDALARYRQIERTGGWPMMPEGKALKKGDDDVRVTVLRQRLYLEGDLNLKPNSKTHFDKAVERGLKSFQRRNGLDPDGVLGASTVKAMNVSASARVRQLRINMERCRWLPDDMGRRYVLVNVPSFTLQIMEDNRQTMEMKVVVGRKMRQTPVFSSTMTHIVLNPPWSVPPKVARMDLLDHIHEEPDYLARHNFEVYANHEDNAPMIDPSKVDWFSVTPENLKYKFRQKPGPLNALGRVKFLLPNRFDVYLHDTPSRSLFSKTVRDFSSGCIRLEKPVELASYLLNWPEEKVETAINSKTGEQVITLPESIPVHLMYWTAWVDEQDKVQFRDDIYGRDTSLNEAINREPGL